MIKIEGEIYITAYNKRHERVVSGSRTSFDIHADDLLITKALEFRDAAKRDGRLFICDLVPRWKRPFLRLLGIRPDGGIGRHIRLKICRRKSCRFDSGSGHHLDAYKYFAVFGRNGMAYKHDDEHDRYSLDNVAPGPTGIGLIHDERERQINEEGFNDVHDAQYKDNELLKAAGAYTIVHIVAKERGWNITEMLAPDLWPFHKSWWKPQSRRRNLERAGALIAAELDRMIAAGEI